MRSNLLRALNPRSHPSQNLPISFTTVQCHTVSKTLQTVHKEHDDSSTTSMHSSALLLQTILTSNATVAAVHLPPDPVSCEIACIFAVPVVTLMTLTDTMQSYTTTNGSAATSVHCVPKASDTLRTFDGIFSSMARPILSVLFALPSSNG